MNVTDAINITEDELLDSCTDDELIRIDSLFKSYELFYQNWHMDAEDYKYMDNTKLDLTVKEFLDDYEKKLKEELKSYDVNKEFDEKVFKKIWDVSQYGASKFLNPTIEVSPDNGNILIVGGVDYTSFLGHKSDLIDFYKEREDDEAIKILEEDQDFSDNDVTSLITKEKVIDNGFATIPIGIESRKLTTKEETSILVNAISYAILEEEIKEQYESHKQKQAGEEM